MATSLNALSMVIGMNTDQVTAGVGSIRQQLGRANRIMQMSKTAGDKLTEGVVALATAYQRGALSQSQYAKGMDSLQSKYLTTSQVAQEASAAEQRVNRLVAQSTPEVAKLTASMRDLITAKRQGKISAEQFGHAQEMLKGQMARLKDEQRKQKEAMDGTADAARKAAERLRRVQQGIQSSIPKTTKLALEIRELRKEYAAGNVSVEQFRRRNVQLTDQYRHLKASMNSTGSSMDAARRKFEEFKKSVKSTTAEMSPLISKLSAVAAGFLSFQSVRGIASITNEFTQSEIALRVFTGSAEEAERMLSEIRSLAADSPLSFADTMKASQTMLAFGTATESVLPNLRMLSDLSGGNSERFQSLALAFSQTQAAGRLMGQEVLQFVNAGFHPLQQIAKDTGIDMRVLKKAMEDGAISAEMVTEAMRSATSEGGRYFGLTEEMSNTAGGAVTQLASAVRELIGQFGSMFEPAVRDVAKALKTAVEFLGVMGSSLSQNQARMIAATASFIAGATAAKTLITVIGGIITAVRTLTAAQITLQAFMGPAGIASIVAGLAVAGGAVWAVNKAFDENAKKAKEAADETENLSDSAKTAARAYDSLRESMKKAKSPADDLIEHYKDQNLLLSLGQEAYERYKAGSAFVANQGKVEELKRLQERNAMLKEEKRLKEEAERSAERAAEKAARDEKKRLEDLKKAGQEVRDSLRSPFEVAADEIARLMMLLRGGFIDQATFQAAASKAAAESRSNTSAPTVAAIEKGSQEAYQRLTGQINDRREKELAKLEEQRLLQSAMVAAQRETNRRIAELQPVRSAR